MAKGQDKRTCVFCGGSRLTKEHGIPRWLDPYFPHPTESIRKVRAKGKDVPSDRGSRKTLSGEEVRRFCESCNNGWMSQLEQQAIPVIGPMVLGEGLQLNESWQAIAATWIVKTYLVLAASERQFDNSESLASIYPEFYRTRMPSNLHKITVGAHCSSSVATFFRLMPGTLKTGHDVEVPGHVATLAIGHLVCHISYFSQPFNLTPPREMGFVWPIGISFIWPRGFLNSAGLESIATTPFGSG